MYLRKCCHRVKLSDHRNKNTCSFRVCWYICHRCKSGDSLCTRRYRHSYDRPSAACNQSLQMQKKKKKKTHYQHILPFFRWHLRPAGLVNYIHHYSWIDLMNEVRDLLASARETSRRVQTVAVTASVIDSALVKICQRNINIGDCTDRS